MPDDLINQRNNAAAMQTLQQIADMMHAQQVRMDAMLATLGNMAAKIEALEVGLLRALQSSVGRGSTSR